MNLVLGITTYNRKAFLKRMLDSWANTRSDENYWTIIIADDGSTDGTIEWLNSLKGLYNNLNLIIQLNNRVGVHQQTNGILQESLKYNFDYGFKADDDIEFLKKGWENLYIEAIIKTGFHHLCFFDISWGKRRLKLNHQTHENGLLSSYVDNLEVHGAFWTFTQKVIQDVGYFDVENFGFCGLGHTDYTWRCCRAGYNKVGFPCDVSGSNSYIQLQKTNYRPACQDNIRYNHNTPQKIMAKIKKMQEPRIYVGLPDNP